MKLKKSLAAWRTPKFVATFKLEVSSLDADQLPLQAALIYSSQVADEPFQVIVLQTDESDTIVRVRTGIMFSGVIAGSCCSDDPGGLCPQTEYCELEFAINKFTADTGITLLTESLD